jgi:hypothetical protein
MQVRRQLPQGADRLDGTARLAGGDITHEVGTVVPRRGGRREGSLQLGDRLLFLLVAERAGYLVDDDLRVAGRDREIVALVGESGSGKTTTTLGLR